MIISDEVGVSFMTCACFQYRFPHTSTFKSPRNFISASSSACFPETNQRKTQVSLNECMLTKIICQKLGWGLFSATTTNNLFSMDSSRMMSYFLHRDCWHHRGYKITKPAFPNDLYTVELNINHRTMSPLGSVIVCLLKMYHLCNFIAYCTKMCY